MNRAYVYRLYPDSEQQILIGKTFGCVRFVYNKMLADRKEAYEKFKDDKDALRTYKPPTPASYKQEYPWLKEVDSLALANGQLNLNVAYRNFFRKPSVGFPKFKSKHRDRKSYTTNNQKGSIRLLNEKTLRLPILKDVKIKLHRPLPENSVIKSATISQKPSGDYYVAILVEFEAPAKTAKAETPIVLGLDYSSKSLYIDSDFRSAEYPRYYRKSEEKLKKAQRILSKRVKGSKNRNKQRIKVAKLHEKVSNQRKDFLHKQSRQITNACDVVVIEDLNMRGMAQGLNLAKSTNDNGFGEFRFMMNYKLEDEGKQLIIINKWFPSSKLCHLCGVIHTGLTLSDRIWTCECGEIHDRDMNAAINIRNEGYRMLAMIQ